MKKYKEDWLPQLEDSIPKEVKRYTLSMYSIALEGWRRGMTLKFVNNNRIIANTDYSLSYKGKEVFFSASRGSLVSKDAIKICLDKHLTKKYLLKSSIPVPEGEKFVNNIQDQDIVNYANILGYPVVLKPSNGASGNGVIANIKNEEEFKDALLYVKYELNYKELIVERFFTGEDYRIFVIGNEVVGAINRISANVIGDGVNTVKRLLRLKEKERDKNPALVGSAIKIDTEMHNMLHSIGYTLESIPEKGERVFLKSKNNISTGGDPVDVTDELTNEIKDIALRATEAIPGLIQGGVDVIFDKEKNTGVVLEINSRPSIRGHLFPMEGQARDIPKAIIDYYFPETISNNSQQSYYFDYKSVWDMFRNGIAQQYIVPNVPQEDTVSTRFVIKGTLKEGDYGSWVRGKAQELKLNGYIKRIDDNDIAIIVSGTNHSVQRFRSIIKEETVKYLKLEKIAEKGRSTPIKVGFEISGIDLNGYSLGKYKKVKASNGMIVGYMRTPKNPGHMAKLLAIMCQHIGIDFIFFGPDNVSIKTGKVKGKMLVNNQWIKVETGLPRFIDINPNYFNSNKHKNVINYLKENTTLSADKRMPLPKDDLQWVFKEDPDVAHYLIPTKTVNGIKDIEEFVNEYKTVVIKPVMSNRGKNIFILKRDKSKYLLGMNKEEVELSWEEFEKIFVERIRDKGFIVQKSITSRDKQGHPFDCRIHVEKDGEGKWSNPKNFIRIGVGQKVISNVSQGGGISELKMFLQSNYQEIWETIYQDIKKLARILPYKVEEFLNQKYMTFGFDIGIDEKGKLYIFEVNDFPIVSPMKSEIAMLRSEYYKYALEQTLPQKMNS